MLGIPSRTEAMAMAPDYAQAVASEELARQLRNFDNLTSTIFPHNHLLEAYRDTGNSEKWETLWEIWEINSKQVPAAVIELLKPEMIRERYLRISQKFRKTLRQAHLKLNQSQDHSRRELTQSALDQATAILDQFEKEIYKLDQLESDKLTKIISLAKLAHQTEQDPTYKRVKSLLSFWDYVWPQSIERDATHPIHWLVTEHRRIADHSNIWLRFDEEYFATKDEIELTQIPTQGVFSLEKDTASVGLSNRISLRDIFNQIMSRLGQVVINGVIYQKKTISVGDAWNGQLLIRYLASGPTYPELVNLLGRPVQQLDGVIVEPESWAMEEVEFIEAFRELEDSEATQKLLARYELDFSHGFPTQAKQLEQLRYICTRHAVV